MGQILRSDLCSTDADFRTAGQRYQMYSRIGYRSILDSSWCGQALDRSIRNTGIHQHFCQAHQCQRVVGGRQHNGCVSHHQSRCNFLIVQITREVERDDAGNDADRFSRHHLDMFFLSGFCSRRNDGAVVVFSVFCKGLEGDADVADLGAGFSDRFSVFSGKGLSQGFLVQLHDIDELVQHVSTFCDGILFPFLLSLDCGCYSFLDILCGCFRNAFDDFSRCRCNDIKGFLAYAVCFLTIYDHFHMYSSPILFML